MSNATPDKPFRAAPAIGQEQLRAYVEGRLDPAQAHAVEQAMEADPLLADAMEGMQLPGALAAMGTLQHGRPGAGAANSTWYTALAVVGVVLMAGAWLVISSLLDQDRQLTRTVPTTQEVSPQSGTAPLPLQAEEIIAAVEQAETLRIGHAAGERHTEVVAKREVVVREQALERLPSSTPPIGTMPDARDRAPRRGGGNSLQLHFLHGLKLVHPSELYPREPQVEMEAQGVSARYADLQEQQLANKRPVMMQYLHFMDKALESFVRNDHKNCLEDLRFLLAQYPNDVNALFYGGLCSYNLGLYSRARDLLHRASTHPIAVFDEEATWYHALTLERMGETEAAQEAFGRIAAQGGFYAERAAGKLRK